MFATFFKIGAFTFGGGYAMISIIENECVSEKKWLSHDEMMDITVVAESTPGPLAINTATFVGYKVSGALGSAMATAGVVLPSLIIIGVIALFLENFLAIRWVASAFRGIKAAVAFLIFGAGWKMFKKMKKNLLSWVIFSLSLLVMLCVSFGFFAFSSIYLIIISATVGLVIYGVNAMKKRGGDENDR
ncbi:MAG: chromate transporter [Ruminococcaceae bacterium]|nr:chromate transporter [Oscillospiraceae bacterium]